MILPMTVASLVLVSACNRLDHMLGKDHEGSGSAASQPAPQPVSAPDVASTYNLYSDNGSAASNDPNFRMYGVGLDPEHEMQLVNTITDGGKTTGVGASHVELNPVAGEGIYFVRIHTDTDGSGAFVMTFDGNGTGRTVDLRGRSAIVFMARLIRTDRPIVANDNIFIEVEDGAGKVASVRIQDVVNFDPKSFAWQTVRIPVSALGEIDLSQIRRPFGMRYAALGNRIHLDVDFDAIRWEP